MQQMLEETEEPMQELKHQPVVIESSLAGLFISHALSRAGIQHILIGGAEPDEAPRLGESMNEVASIDFWNLLGSDFQQYFYTKSHISLFNGPFVSMSYLGNPNRSIQALANRKEPATFWNTSDNLIHVDRSQFDKALYHTVKNSPQCLFIEKQAAEIIYDHVSDRITEIRLEDMRRLDSPSYVFDATGASGGVAQAAKVGQTAISHRQRVVWTHYTRDSNTRPSRHWWQYGTNLLRLVASLDGIDGIAWLIPLGNTISVGISVRASTEGVDRMSKDALIQTLNDAFWRRGIVYRPLFTLSKPIMERHLNYFICDRAYGANWVLADGSYTQIWFPSSSGVASSTMAAHLAPQFLKEPAKTGAYYEAAQRALLGIHRHLNAMIEGPSFTHHNEVYAFWSQWSAAILLQLGKPLSVSNHNLPTHLWTYQFLEQVGGLTGHSQFLQHYGLDALITSVQNPFKLSDQGHAFKTYFDYPSLYLQNASDRWLRLINPRGSKRL